MRAITKWGDDTRDLELLLHLYKSEVLLLARILRKIAAGEELGKEDPERVTKVRAILERAPRRQLKNRHLGSPLP